MTRADAIRYIHSAHRFGIKLGLDNMQRLMAELGNPQADLSIIHIAGTNGKGSTASFIAHCLMEEGYRVGRYVSPYIEVFHERIQIDRDYIDDQSLVDITQMVKSAVERLGDDFQPTEFEIVTAIGFVYFKRKKVDVVVLEVGMGGRFDSTNIIESPLAAVITPISYDHMAYLGDTLEAIATEKAGIIKADGLVISSQSHYEAAAVIEQTAKTQRAKLVVSDWHIATDVNYLEHKTCFVYKSQRFTIGMLGYYQVQNACTAIATLRALNRTGRLPISNRAIVDGMAKATWLGRFEKICDNPVVIIDGAHNIAAVEVFLKSVAQYYNGVHKTAIFGVMADKAVDQMIALVVDVFDAFILVEPDNPRAMNADVLNDKLLDLGYAGTIKIARDLSDVQRCIVASRDANTVYFAFGSLYYLGELRRLCIESK